MIAVAGGLSPLHLAGVAAAAGLGAMCRVLVDRRVVARFGATRLPWATLLVNVAGSLLLGLVLSWAPDGAPGPGDPQLWRLLVGTGFCGGLTTFSTFSVESFLLLHEGRGRAALVYGTLTMGLGLAAVLVGSALGSALS